MCKRSYYEGGEGKSENGPTVLVATALKDAAIESDVARKTSGLYFGSMYICMYVKYQGPRLPRLQKWGGLDRPCRPASDGLQQQLIAHDMHMTW